MNDLTPAPVPVPAPAPAGLDLMAGFGAPAPAPAPAGGMDLLAGFGAPAPAAPAGAMGGFGAPAAAGGGNDWMAGCLDPQGQAVLSTARSPMQAKQELQGDANIHVSYQTYYKDDELVVVLFLFNRTAGPLPVNVVFDKPSGTMASYAGFPQMMSNGDSASFQGVPPGQAANVQCTLKPNSTDLGFSVVAMVEYQGMSGSSKMNVNISLSMSDFLRPVPNMAVPQFGQQWQAPGMVERKVNVPNSSARSPEVFMQKCSMFNIHPIQAIGTEAVAVGKLIGINVPVLIHGKTAPAALDVLIRSPDKTLAEAVQATVRTGPVFR